MSGIVRVEKNGNYTVMNRTALQDTRLSWKAKGIIAYMLSMPDDWVFYMDELMTHATDGKTSFQNGMRELKECGYVERRPVREGQRIKSWETIVHEIPRNSLQTDFQQVENLEVQKQEVGFVQVENEPLLSTDYLLNTEFINNNDDDKRIPAYAEENQKPNPFKFYEENGFGGIQSHVANKINIWIDDLNEELIVHAMKLAAENNVLKWSYVETILKDWYNKKFKSISDVEADRLRFEAQRNKKQNSTYRGKPNGRQEMVPEWFKNRNSSTQEAPVAPPLQENQIDAFEAAKQKVLQRLGNITED